MIYLSKGGAGADSDHTWIRPWMVSVLAVFGACDFAAWKRVAFNVGNLYWWVTHYHASDSAPTVGRWWPNVKWLRRWEFPLTSPHMPQGQAQVLFLYLYLYWILCNSPKLDLRKGDSKLATISLAPYSGLWNLEWMIVVTVVLKYIQHCMDPGP